MKQTKSVGWSPYLAYALQSSMKSVECFRFSISYHPGHFYYVIILCWRHKASVIDCKVLKLIL